MISSTFVRRPIATSLLALALVLVGLLAWFRLPVAALPNIAFPTIMVQANLSGANPETMAATVATPLERALGEISGIEQMVSTSSQGSSRIIIQFALNKDINEAAREVQAAINTAQALLPSAMTSRPRYRKANPANAPLMILVLSSPRLSQGELYTVADQIISPRISRIEGVSSVTIGGSSPPAIRIDVDPQALAHEDISLQLVANAIGTANTNYPKGTIETDTQALSLGTNSQLFNPKDYEKLIIASRNQGEQNVRLGDVAHIYTGVENPYSAGFFNHQSAVLLIIRPTVNANIVATSDAIREQIPIISNALPTGAQVDVMLDRSPSIRDSLTETQFTLLVGVILVVGVIYLFLKTWRATLIPSVTIPVTLIATFAVLYLMDYSLNTMTLMALIVSVGFVVDDAIVVVENIARYIEKGLSPVEAALRGSKEMSFTIVSMSLSLLAVLIPLLLPTGIVGKLFSAFAVTLATTIIISMIISLTLTPALSARFLNRTEILGRKNYWQEKIQTSGHIVQQAYQRSLDFALRHHRLTLLSLFVVIGLNFFLFMQVPKTFLPTQDTGRITTFVDADQSLGFEALQNKFTEIRQVLLADPRISHVLGFISAGGRGGGASAFLSIELNKNRRQSTQEIANELSKKFSNMAGLQIYMFGAQDMPAGGRDAGGEYSMTLLSSDLNALKKTTLEIEQAFKTVPELTGVNSDQTSQGQAIRIVVDRDQAMRLGIDMADVDLLLANAYGERYVSSIFQDAYQYYVIMQVSEAYRLTADNIAAMYVFNRDNKAVPLTSFAHLDRSVLPVEINHQDQFAATTVSFNLNKNIPLSQGLQAATDKLNTLYLPSSVIVKLGGDAQRFQDSQSAMPLLILGAIVAVYLVLGILYESYIHPLTILSTLPSAGVGAFIALEITGEPFSIIALIGIILLIGIVKKNAILMVDFALNAERNQQLTPVEAIRQAALVRFRPIMMTTLAAILGAIPLMLGHDENAQLRAPLGITIIGGLIVSQLLTIYTTPVVYLYFDRMKQWRLWSFWRTKTPSAKS